MNKLTLNFANINPDTAKQIAETQIAMEETRRKIASEEIKKQAKLLKQQNINQAQQFLTLRFPKVFDPQKPLPLKVNVLADIFDDPSIITKLTMKDFSKTVLRAVITQWCQSQPYLQALIANQQRFDLQAEPVQNIDPKHQKRAKNILNKFFNKNRK